MRYLAKKAIQNKDKIIVILIMIVLVIIKQGLLYHFPIIGYLEAGEDDALMVELAENILQGKWLGEYSYHTLVKGPTFPMFLAFCKYMGWSYMATVTALYSISCVVFMIAIRKIIKNKYIFLGMFAILLFNPIMYAQEVIQRVYRNALIPPFVLFITGSFFAIYLRREETIWQSIPWVIIASISLSLFYYTREDSIWIMPFILFMIMVTIITLIMQYKHHIRKICPKIIILAIPVISLSLFGNWIAHKNEMYYGLKTTNVLSHSNFSHAMKAIYAVKPNIQIDYVTVPNEKMERMAQVSETFAYVKPQVSMVASLLEGVDRNPGDGEIEDGWFFWALRIGLAQCGIKTLEGEQEIYQKITDELNDAMEQGLLERQSTMPSALMPPWRKGNSIKLIKTIGKMVIYISTYDSLSIANTNPTNVYIPEEYAIAKKFEDITGDTLVFAQDAVNLEGNPVSELKTQQDYIDSVQIQNDILNNLIKVYSIMGIILGIIGVIGYINLTIRLIRRNKI